MPLLGFPEALFFSQHQFPPVISPQLIAQWVPIPKELHPNWVGLGSAPAPWPLFFSKSYLQTDYSWVASGHSS